MKIAEILKKHKPLFSLEVFPPKPDYPVETIYQTLDGLKTLSPNFISVTYGAGGGNRERTVEIASAVKDKYGIEALAHLTCVGHSRQDIEQIISSLESERIVNILALRGDPPKTTPVKTGDFRYARELVEFLRERGGFSIGAAAYPEGHPETPDPKLELDYLQEKVEAGVDFLITQMVFDNRYIYDLLDRLAKRRVSSPVLVGIMPLFNIAQIKRINSLSGATVPPELVSILAEYADSPEETERIGIDFAVRQINELLQNGIAGIHLYTMNKARLAKEIFQRVCANT